MSSDAFASSAPRPESSDIHPVYERRFRTERYFLEDQLQHSDVLQDFRSVQSALRQSASFQLNRLFAFVPIPVRRS